LRLLVALIGLIVTLVLASSAAYIGLMFYEQPARGEAWIEAFNFSVQTVTTVGYGNWDQPRVLNNLTTHERELRVFATKVVSLPVMFFGALFFGMIPSTLVVLLLR
jgi:hypothetical protein